MKMLTGHHWRTHGLFDLVVFFLLGWVFMRNRIPAGGLTNGLAATVAVASIASGAALGLWFLLV